MTRRLACAGLLLAGALTVPAAAAPTDGGAVYVPSTGETVTTPFATTEDHAYVVTVTGAYSYNGAANLADCGWWNPEGEGDAWYRGGFLLLDGAPATCSAQPYTTTHTYTWTEYGTGAPLALRIVDGGYADNAGGLVVEVTEVHGRHDVTGYCETSTADNDDSLPKTILVAPHARASGGGGAPPLLRATCTVTGDGGRAEVSSVPGPGVTAGADVVLLPNGAYQVCLHVFVEERLAFTYHYSLGCREV